MEKNIDYHKLYKLQDKVLAILFQQDNNFYLTGGTALHRYNYNLRYSDDLDFFAENDANFNEHINGFLFALKEQGILFSHPVSSRDFGRIIIDDYLQIDFVNDHVYREGVSRIVEDIRVDNIRNILSNKLGALIDRDEEKDFFDLFAIAYNETFKWKEVLRSANKKSYLDKDQLIYRIETFPLSWLDRIKSVKPMKISKNDISRLTVDLREETSNSLCK